MLTLILLVVLAGGSGLMAVWLIDARGLSDLVDRTGWRSLRRPRRSASAGGTGLVAPAAPVRQAATVAPPPVAERTRELPRPAEPPPSVAPAVTYVPVEAPLEPLPVEAARRGTKRVPAAYTAVEGSYRDVARSPLWRKVTSLVSLLVVLVLVAGVVTALTGAAFGLLAELVDGAIG